MQVVARKLAHRGSSVSPEDAVTMALNLQNGKGAGRAAGWLCAVYRDTPRHCALPQTFCNLPRPYALDMWAVARGWVGG